MPTAEASFDDSSGAAAASVYYTVPDSGDTQGVGLLIQNHHHQQQQQQQQQQRKENDDEDVEEGGSSAAARPKPFEQEQPQPQPEEEEEGDGIFAETSASLLVFPSFINGWFWGWWSRQTKATSSSCSSCCSSYFDNNNNNNNNRNNENAAAKNKLLVVQTCYMGLAAILGCLLRITLAQLFGEECKNPGTVGWLSAGSPLCVTRDGQTGQMGGIIFADLPANVLGSFLMGMMQDSASLGLAVHAPVAWLSPSHAFQGYTVLHLAIKTGFCGSLTTFSSWIAEMTVMLVGEEATHRESQFWKALFGFVIGIQTALGGYMFGRTCSIWLHQWRNPALAEEARAIQTKKEQGYMVNPKLPALERRFLPDLPLYLEGEYPAPRGSSDGDGDDGDDDAAAGIMDSLSQWRESTKEARRFENASSTGALLEEVETALLADHKPLLPELESLCRKEGWNIDALLDYLRHRRDQQQQQQHQEEGPIPKNDDYLTAAGVRKDDGGAARLFQWPYALALFVLVLTINAVLLVTIPSDNAYNITYRTMVYSFLLAPVGAITRWHLGNKFNNNGGGGQLPFGTMTANFVGSAISMSMIALEYRLEENVDYGFWTVATFRAIKLGFCGCLTTVSTFIAEVHTMMMLQRNEDRAYKYILLSLCGATALAMTAFCLIVYTAPVY